MIAPLPPGRFLTAHWRHLLMLNFEVEPALLKPLVPKGTELDSFAGKTYASIVGFRFERTRVLGLPVPYYGDFDEINLRLYVGREVQGAWRRGVVFVKEIVPRPLIAWIARAFYNEGYVSLPMKHRLRLPEKEGDAGSVRYAWYHGRRWHHLEARFAGPPHLPEPGSLAEFITEHYWGYTIQKDRSTKEYQVEHPPWRVWQATQPRFDCDVASFYGPTFQPCLSAAPVSAFLAEGSPVVVHKGCCLG